MKYFHYILIGLSLSFAFTIQAQKSDCGSLFFQPDFSKANLINANFSNANVPNIDFSYANLTGADLENTNLSYANLTGANLTGANLKGADLSYANLENAEFKNAIYDSQTKFPEGFNPLLFFVSSKVLTDI